ncbi:PQQ-dependent sugar dehydrogenase [Microbacterium halophytorum]|uniref:PQQ-dependent sugar dehydrogenase n=1 Tax=Microbacterium halophytorum TaxID=2067568 RepID=UPI001E3717E7|nr:PQQ-dependent sugar dehydrogenase [Microbacterium halophytorum]
MSAVAVPAVAHEGHEDPPAEAVEPALDVGNYERNLITRDIGEPIDMAVLPDGRVLTTARGGEVRLHDPSLGTTEIVNEFDVYANSEDGMQGIALDPDFEENGWVYAVYAPRDADGDGEADTPEGNAPETLPEGEDESYWEMWEGVNRLSRFQWTGSGLDMSTEQSILDIGTQRGQCCHVGADIDFDGEGNLYLTTGDNTPASTPGANGYAPNNDAPGMNPGFDSRRGAGNTNDLRGKILRIHVEDDGSYTIPEGNLFAPGTEGTRPEIFVMGVRNPFRFEVDPETNSLSWGDYGPDASQASDVRGPMGYVEWNVVGLDDPHNSGWPYVHGPNAAYNDWDFETETAGEFFDPENLVNDSRWNTGLTELPAAREATVYYGDNPGDQPWDELVEFGTSNGQAPMGGPVYHYDPENPDTALPEHWDGKAFMGEFSQDYVAAMTVDWETFEVTAIEDFLPNAELIADGQHPHDNPMDIEIGPDGSMWMLDYGDGFFRANPDAGLYRIDYAPNNKTPQASFTVSEESSSEAPLTVDFDASATVDPDGDELTYEWDLDGDGEFEATGVTASHTYDELGAYSARLRVTDDGGKFSATSQVISVGNQAPEVTVEFPADGGFFAWGDRVPFSIATSDAEDGEETVCENVTWTYGLGHDEHAHPESSGTGCEGEFRTDANSPEHGAGAELYGAVVVNYEDQGANGLPPAKGEATVRLNPKGLEAEHAAGIEGTEPVADGDASGGNAVGELGEGDYLEFSPVNFTNIDGAVIAARGEGEVQLRWGAADAEPFATAVIPAGEGWQNAEVAFDAPEGTGDLFVTSADGVAIDVITVTGAGVAEVPDEPEPEPAETTTNAELSAESVAFGDGAEVHVATTSEGGVPAGEVVVSEGDVELARGELDEAGEAVIALPNDLAVGSHALTVEFLGGEAFLASSDEVVLEVTETETEVTAEFAARTVAPGEQAQLDVAVATASGAGAPGEVSLEIKHRNRVVETLTAELVDGAASVSLPGLDAGTYRVLVTYDGGEGVKGSHKNVVLKVR